MNRQVFKSSCANGNEEAETQQISATFHNEIAQTKTIYTHTVKTLSMTDKVVPCSCREVEEVIYQSLKDQWDHIRKTRQYRIATKCRNRITDTCFTHHLVFTNQISSDVMSHILDFLHPSDYTPYYSTKKMSVPVAKDLYAGDDTAIVMGETGPLTIGLGDGQCHPSLCHAIYGTYDMVSSEVTTRVDYQSYPTLSGKTSKVYIEDLTVCGDIESNPGPVVIFPKEYNTYLTHENKYSFGEREVTTDSMVVSRAPQQHNPPVRFSTKCYEIWANQKPQFQFAADVTTTDSEWHQVPGRFKGRTIQVSLPTLFGGNMMAGKGTRPKEKTSDNKVKDKPSAKTSGVFETNNGRITTKHRGQFFDMFNVRCSKNAISLCAGDRVCNAFNDATVTNGYVVLKLQTGMEVKTYTAGCFEVLAAAFQGTNCKCGGPGNCGKLNVTKRPVATSSNQTEIEGKYDKSCKSEPKTGIDKTRATEEQFEPESSDRKGKGKTRKPREPTPEEIAMSRAEEAANDLGFDIEDRIRRNNDCVYPSDDYGTDSTQDSHAKKKNPRGKRTQSKPETPKAPDEEEVEEIVVDPRQEIINMFQYRTISTIQATETARVRNVFRPVVQPNKAALAWSIAQHGLQRVVKQSPSCLAIVRFFAYKMLFRLVVQVLVLIKNRLLFGQTRLPKVQMLFLRALALYLVPKTLPHLQKASTTVSQWVTHKMANNKVATVSLAPVVDSSFTTTVVSGINFVPGMKGIEYSYDKEIDALRVESNQDGAGCHQILRHFNIHTSGDRAYPFQDALAEIAQKKIPYMVNVAGRCYRNNPTSTEAKTYAEFTIDIETASVHHISVVVPRSTKFLEAVPNQDGLLGVVYGMTSGLTGLPQNALVLGNNFGEVDAQPKQLRFLDRQAQRLCGWFSGPKTFLHAYGTRSPSGSFVHFNNCGHVLVQSPGSFRPCFPQLHEHDASQLIQSNGQRTSILQKCMRCCCLKSHIEAVCLLAMGQQPIVIGTVRRMPANIVLNNTNYLLRKQTLAHNEVYVEGTRAVSSSYYTRTVFRIQQHANAALKREDIDRTVPVGDAEALAKFRGYLKEKHMQSNKTHEALFESVFTAGSPWRVEEHVNLGTVIHTFRAEMGMADKYAPELRCDSVASNRRFDLHASQAMFVRGRQSGSRGVTLNSTAPRTVDWINALNHCMHHSRKPEYCTACRNFQRCPHCGCFYMHTNFVNTSFGNKGAPSRGQADFCGLCSSRNPIEKSIKLGMMVGHVINVPTGIYYVTPFQIFRQPLCKSGEFAADVKVEVVDNIPTSDRQPGATFYGIGSAKHCPTMASVSVFVALSSLSSRQLAVQKSYKIQHALSLIEQCQHDAAYLATQMDQFGYRIDGQIRPESMIRFLRKYFGAKRQRYFDAFCNLVSSTEAEEIGRHVGCTVRIQNKQDQRARFKEARRAIFIKNELLQPTVAPLDVTEKAARIICSSEDPERNVRLGPYIASVQSFLKKFWSLENIHLQEGTPVVFACGLSNVALGKLMAHFMRFGYIAGADYGKYDSNQKWFHFACEKALYERAGISKKAMKVFTDQANNTATIKIGGKIAIRAQWRYRRNSGDPNTTLGNSWLNAGMLRWAIAKLCRSNGWSVKDFIIAVGGDDVMIASIHPPESWKTQLEQILLDSFGMPTEWQVPENPMNIRFMGSTAYYDGDRIVAGPCIERFLQKVGWSSRPQVDFMGWNKGVAQAWLASYGHVPFVHALCSSVYRCCLDAEAIECTEYKFKNQEKTWSQPDPNNYQVIVDQLSDIGCVATIPAVQRFVQTLGQINQLPALISDPIWDQLAW